jgi:hypothetical protein
MLASISRNRGENISISRIVCVLDSSQEEDQLTPKLLKIFITE